MSLAASFPADWQVPAYTCTEFFPKRNRYAMAVFVINEGERIRRQLAKMTPLAGRVDIVVADGGSTDGSLDEAFLREAGVRLKLVKTGPGKLSAQMRMALAHLMTEGYEGVIVVDGNDKDDTSAAPLFIEALDAGIDHVQGSRYVKGGQAINTPFMRHWGVTLLHAPMISLAARRRYTDTSNGFRAYSRALLTDPRVKPFRDVFVGYELHYYLAIRSSRLGFKVKEVPVTRRYPESGPIPSKISPFRGSVGILKVLARACMGRYNP